ncbi:unnamed protein product [Oikopleura dioica]|uniref:Uncharacterized protein n=1 Tax=Oikopleura dioica TaxID=34765 RepID=E4YCN3_OIKDI|nr:unnamed protein product [Oikopleura dioica]
MIGRAVKVVFYNDAYPLDPSKHVFEFESMILYEFTMESGDRGLAYENLAVFLEQKTSNKIKTTAKKWKKQKTKYSPLPPNDLMIAQYGYLIKRDKKTHKETNKEKRKALKGLLQQLTTLDFDTFKKKSSIIGEDHQLQWKNAGEFKSDVLSAICYYQKNIVNKRGGLGLGSQYTIETRAESPPEKDNNQSRPKQKKRKALPRL